MLLLLLWIWDRNIFDYETELGVIKRTWNMEIAFISLMDMWQGMAGNLLLYRNLLG